LHSLCAIVAVAIANTIAISDALAAVEITVGCAIPVVIAVVTAKP
jgi:hypothetical protein